MLLQEYILSLKDEHAEEGEELGVFELANTANPAIKLKGIAFNAQKPLHFTDNLKYRIAAPALTPGKVYRRDEETGEESYYVVTDEFVEDAFLKFMATRMGEQVFNEEHDVNVKPPSFILETWLVEDPKTDKSLTVYGIECPPKTWFVVQQFTDKDVYHDYVDRGLTGFSIHGHSALLQMSEHKHNTNLDNMDKQVFELDGKKYMPDENGQLVEVTEEVTEETEMSEDKTVEVEAEAQPEAEAEVVAEAEATEATAEAETTEEETVGTELNEDTDEKKEESEETEMSEDMPGEYYTREEIDAKIAELETAFAERLASMDMPANAGTEMSDDNVQMSEEVPEHIKKMNKLTAFATVKETIAKHKKQNKNG